MAWSMGHPMASNIPVSCILLPNHPAGIVFIHAMLATARGRSYSAQCHADVWVGVAGGWKERNYHNIGSEAAKFWEFNFNKISFHQKCDTTWHRICPNQHIYNRTARNQVWYCVCFVLRQTVPTWKSNWGINPLSGTEEHFKYRPSHPILFQFIPLLG